MKFNHVWSPLRTISSSAQSFILDTEQHFIPMFSSTKLPKGIPHHGTYQHLEGGASFPGSHTWLPGNEAILGGGTPFQKTGWATVWLTHHRQLQHPWSGYTGWGCAPRWCNPAGSSPSLYTGSQRNRWSHVHHQSWLNENVGSHDNTWLQKVITGSKNSAKIKNAKIVMWVQVASFLGIPHL